MRGYDALGKGGRDTVLAWGGTREPVGASEFWMVGEGDGNDADV